MRSMTTPDFDHSVQQIIRKTAQEIIIPAAANIDRIGKKEKKPNDFATEADTAMEVALKEKLCALLPGSVSLGEEETHDNPGLIAERLAGDAPVWIIDPIDGTQAFIDQNGGYGPIVALCHHGKIAGAWIHDVTRADGYIDHHTKLDSAPAARPELFGHVGKRLVGDIEPFMDAARYGIDDHHPACCVAYRELLAGQADFLLYWQAKPWDHFAGLHLAQKAGLAMCQWNGEAIDYTREPAGLIVARDDAIVARIRQEILLPAVTQGKLRFPGPSSKP